MANFKVGVILSVASQKFKAGMSAVKKAAADGLGALGSKAKKASRDVDKATRSVDRAAASAKKAQGPLVGAKKAYLAMSVAAGIAAAAIGKIMGVVGGWIKAANIQERAETKLATTLKQLTGATDAEIQALKDQAAALQKTTGYGDEATISAQAMLGTFELTAEQVGELTPRLLDMAESQRKLGNAGVDLEQISIAVGKSFSDGITGLKRYGVKLTELQQEEFKTADQQRKTAILTEALDANYKGLAAAVGDIYEGALRKASTAQGDLDEKLGESFTKNKAWISLQNSIAAGWESMSAGVESSASEIGEAVSFLAGTVKVAFGAIQATWNATEIAFKGLVYVINFGIEALNRSFALVTWGDWADDFNAAADKVAAKNKGISESIGEDVADLERAGRTMLGAFDEAGEAAVEAEPKVNRFGEALGGAAAKARAVKDKLAAMAEATKRVDAELSMLGETVDSLNSGLNTGTRESFAAFNRLLVEAGDNSMALMRGLQQAAKGVDSLDVLRAMTLQVAAAVEEGRLSDEQAEVAKRLLLERAQEVADNMRALGASFEDVTEKSDDLTDSLDDIPGDVDVTITVATNEAESSVDRITEKTKKHTKATEETTEAVKKAGQAQAEAAGHTAAAGGVMAKMIDTMGNARAMMGKFSEGALEMFDGLMKVYNQSRDTGIIHQKSENQIKNLQHEIRYLKKEMMGSSNEISKWFKQIGINTAKTEIEFRKQKASAEGAIAALQNWGKEGSLTSQSMLNNLGDVSRSYALLDKATLSRLQSEVDRVTAANERMEDSAKSALQQYEDMISRQAGDELGIAERQRARDLAQIEKDIATARTAGNLDAIADLQKTKKLAEQYHTEEIRLLTVKLEAEKKLTAERKARDGADTAGPGARAPVARPPTLSPVTAPGAGGRTPNRLLPAGPIQAPAPTAVDGWTPPNAMTLRLETSDKDPVELFGDVEAINVLVGKLKEAGATAAL